VFPHLNIGQERKETTVYGISCDSRFVKKGDIFFVLKGEKFNIFSVLKDIEPKVKIFIANLDDACHLKTIRKPVILVKNVHNELTKAVNLFYRLKGEKLNLIGVTGTNGKTTTAHLVYHCLKKSAKSAALISTVKCVFGRKTIKSVHTTPDFLSLRSMIKDIQEKNIQFVVMEVSSHGIIQKRIRGLEFSSCVFTNLSRDHLDYHKTMDNYFKAKSKLFLNNRRMLSVVNADDKYGQRIIRKMDKVISFGINNNATVKACNICMDGKGTYFNLHYKGAVCRVKTFLLGKYNVSNILAAIGVLLGQGIPLKTIIKAVSSFRAVEGRLNNAGENIFVDYAHTPDALENTLIALKDIGYKKIICVFGCGGERDRGKRRLMGKVASQNADFTIITSDNPRGESVLAICSQIKKGFSEKKYSVVLDRKKAIEKAIVLLSENNSNKKEKNFFLSAGKACLLVAGKGHEDYQVVRDRKVPFEDKRVIKECLSRLRGKMKVTK